MTKPPSQARRSGLPPNALGRAEFAAAFLQRNRQYRADRTHLGKDAIVSEQEALARRWGLSFRLFTR